MVSSNYTQTHYPTFMNDIHIWANPVSRCPDIPKTGFIVFWEIEKPPFFSQKNLPKRLHIFSTEFALSFSDRRRGAVKFWAEKKKKKKNVNLLFYTVKQNRKLQQPATHKPPVVQQANISYAVQINRLSSKQRQQLKEMT